MLSQLYKIHSDIIVLTYTCYFRENRCFHSFKHHVTNMQLLVFIVRIWKHINVSISTYGSDTLVLGPVSNKAGNLA